MTGKKKARLKPTTAKISKEKLAELLKKAEEEDPDAGENVPVTEGAAEGTDSPAKKKAL